MQVSCLLESFLRLVTYLKSINEILFSASGLKKSFQIQNQRTRYFVNKHWLCRRQEKLCLLDQSQWLFRYSVVFIWYSGLLNKILFLRNPSNFWLKFQRTPENGNIPHGEAKVSSVRKINFYGKQKNNFSIWKLYFSNYTLRVPGYDSCIIKCTWAWIRGKTTEIT